jgi:hypothetical protein
MVEMFMGRILGLWGIKANHREHGEKERSQRGLRRGTVDTSGGEKTAAVTLWNCAAELD